MPPAAGGSAPGPGRLRDVRPSTAPHRASEPTRPRPPDPGRTSGGALHLDQPDAARPSEACATGCRPSRERPELWEKAERDQHVREHLAARLTDKMADTDTLSATKRAELRGRSPPSPVSTGSCASPPPASCGSTRPPSRPRPASTASTTALLRPRTNLRTSPWATSSSSRSNAAGAT
jgi:hypothetical protein